LLDAVRLQISRRLEAHFTDPTELDGPNTAIQLRERGRNIIVEIPETLLIEATTDATAREAFRVRIKARRDRMMFRQEPARLPKKIAPAHEPFFQRGGPGRRPPGR
jgi:hypothetical protein